MIADGQYAVGDGMVWLEDTKGEHIGRQKLSPDDDPASVARRMLRAKHQAKSSVPGFYDGPYSLRRGFGRGVTSATAKRDFLKNTDGPECYSSTCLHDSRSR